MKNVKLTSGYIKVERSSEEKRKSYTASSEVIQEIRDKMPRRMADAIINSYEKAKRK
jgi:rRNA maturation endonuclease Nob1